MFKSTKVNIFSILTLFAMLLTMQPVMNFLFYFFFIYCVNLSLGQKFSLNPYFLFSITLFSIIFYNPRYSSFLMEIPVYIYVIIFFGVLSFFIGLVIADKFAKSSRYIIDCNSKTLNKRLFRILLVIGLIPHLIGFMNVGIPILNPNDVGELRESYLPAGMSYLVFFLPLTIIIGFIENNKRLIFISTFLNAFVSIIKVSKFDIVIFVFFFLFSYLKYNKGIISQYKKYFIFVTILSAVPFIFEWFYNLRNQSDSFNSDYVLSNSLDSGYFSNAISLPYLYLTTGWSNFTQTIQVVDSFNFGAYTFYPFISALQMNDFLDYSSIKVIYMHPFNTFSFLTDYFMDFGVIGVVVIPFLVGFLVFSSYRRSMAASDAIRDGQFVIFAIPTLLLFFSNHFTSVGYPFIVYILYGVVGKIVRIDVK